MEKRSEKYFAAMKVIQTIKKKNLCHTYTHTHTQLHVHGPTAPLPHNEPLRRDGVLFFPPCVVLQQEGYLMQSRPTPLSHLPLVVLFCFQIFFFFYNLCPVDGFTPKSPKSRKEVLYHSLPPSVERSMMRCRQWYDRVIARVGYHCGKY